MGKRAIGALLFVICLVSVTTGAVFFQQVGSGMVGFWRFEEAAGTTAADSSGNGYNGTWTGGVSSLPGPANTPPLLGPYSTACTSFNGTNAFVSVPHQAALTLPNDFTVCLWVYKTVEATDYVRIVGKGASAVRTFGVWEEPGAGQRILFQRYGAANISFYSVGPNPNIPLNAWTHIACRVSGNGTLAAIFIDGVANGTQTQSGPAATDTDPLTIGYGPGMHTYWNGRIDDVRLYNRPLSDQEIADIAAGMQGPAAPVLSGTFGASSAVLTWTGTATVFNVKRSSTQGGPYTAIASNVAGNTYTDNTAGSFYYVVSGVTYGEGANSNEVAPPVTALPNTGLQTSETGTPTNFTIKFNTAAPVGDSVVQVISSNTGEGVVSTAFPGAVAITDGFQVTVTAGTAPSILVTVTGVDDAVADPAHAYTVTVTASGMNATIPPIQLVNNDNDTAGITFSKTAGLVTSESGQPDSFTVSLNTQPNGPITMTLASSNPAECIVSPTLITFTTANWFTAQPVTVTGVDDAAIDFAQPYAIVSGNLSAPTFGDGVYDGMKPPDVSGVNLDNESIPPAHGAWGGCGLLGAEIGLPLLLLALWRRRRA